jgi:hypothetical protein
MQQRLNVIGGSRGTVRTCLVVALLCVRATSSSADSSSPPAAPYAPPMIQRFPLANYVAGDGTPTDQELAELRRASVVPVDGFTAAAAAASPPAIQLVAFQGLRAALVGDLASARIRGAWLLEQAESVSSAGALMFYRDDERIVDQTHTLSRPWPQASTQGFALGLFSHLYAVTHEEQWRTAARRTFAGYAVPIARGGFTRYENGLPFFEDVPVAVPHRALAGFAIAALALVDYSRVCEDPAAWELFERAIQNFDKHALDYVAISPQTAYVASLTHLARRPPILLRLAAMQGNVWVASAKLVRVGDDAQADARGIEIGAADDERRDSPIGFVWIDPQYQSWGPPTDHEGRRCRNAHALPNAEYHHAPFTLLAPIDPMSAGRFELQLEVCVEAEASADVQVFDGTEFHSVLHVEAGAENVERWHTVRSELPRAAVEKIFAVLDGGAADGAESWSNWRLTELLAAASGSKPLIQLSDCLNESWTTFNGTAATTVLGSSAGRFFPLKPVGDRPIIDLAPGQESVHCEYPSVIRGPDGRYRLYYCAYGDDRRWRLHYATSAAMEGPWQRQGLVDLQGFSDERNVAFPEVVYQDPDRPQQGYHLYFSASDRPAAPYTGLHYARSSDGVHFEYVGRIVDDGALDPAVIRGANGLTYIYYSSMVPTGTALKCVIGDDRGRFTKPRVLIDAESGYTVSALRISPQIALVFLESFSGLTCGYMRLTDNSFIRLAKIRSPTMVPYYYGFHFYRDDDDSIHVFGNGIAAPGADSGGAIWRFRFDPAMLGTMVDTEVRDLTKVLRWAEHPNRPAQ